MSSTEHGREAVHGGSVPFDILHNAPVRLFHSSDVIASSVPSAQLYARRGRPTSSSSHSTRYKVSGEEHEALLIKAASKLLVEDSHDAIADVTNVVSHISAPSYPSPHPGPQSCPLLLPPLTDLQRGAAAFASRPLPGGSLQPLPSLPPHLVQRDNEDNAKHIHPPSSTPSSRCLQCCLSASTSFMPMPAHEHRLA